MYVLHSYSNYDENDIKLWHCKEIHTKESHKNVLISQNNENTLYSDDFYL